MPIGVVPKPNSDKLRLVTDHSAGKFSLNSMIGKPAPDEKVQLDNIQDLGHNLLRVRRFLPNIELDIFKSDVAEAYRLMPMHPLWQIKQVVSIGRRRMWIVAMCLEDVAQKIFDDTFSWEYRDNTVWYHPYNRMIPRKQCQLLRLWDELGIPHRSEKQIFGSPLPVIGFDVDPNAMTVSISDERRNALVAGIKDFVGPGIYRQRRPLRHFQSLAGWIQWSFNVFPLLRPGLSLLYHKIRGKQQPHALVEVSVALRNELLWLADHVERSHGVLMLRSLAWAYDSADLIIYTDASFLGMGFWIPQLQLAFQSRLPTVAGTIFFWECLTVVSAIHWAASNSHVPTPLRLLIYCDNSNTVDLFSSMHAQPQYNPLLCSAVNVLIPSGIDHRVAHIPGKLNGMADAVSRRDRRRALQLCPDLTILDFSPPRDALGDAVNYLSGICHQLEPFFPNVRNAQRSKLVTQTLAGCSRLRGTAPDRKTLLTRLQLTHAIHSIPVTSPDLDDLLFVTLIATAFHGLLRLGELVVHDNPRQRDDRAITERQSVCVLANGFRFLLPTSKTDRVFNGAEIIITGSAMDDDPLAPFLRYLHSRDHQFPFHPHLWLRASGKPPTRTWFMCRLQTIFPADITGHSMCAGGATALAEDGVPLDYIQLLGHWTSDMFCIYIRKNPSLLCSLLFCSRDNPS
ncbi:hypothetical protein EVG20_g11389 [Dentipellis fragilis]|uniref:Tyr recombinase domain-containing protein n=1 Tax=Dentipellis fragilis TaxID=205917 RepID=A0A4Y9XLT1_9AGAM|nr:hypothetical protein EVG20_g11389 [Dentipellis fragilis]